MIKKYLLFLPLILGCQKEWLDNEKSDFRARCNNPEISVYWYPEEFTDCNPTGSICKGDEHWEDALGNGFWDKGEIFKDSNKNSIYDRDRVEVSKKERETFCECSLNELLNLDLSYDEFLKKENLKEIGYINQILDACTTD